MWDNSGRQNAAANSPTTVTRHAKFSFVFLFTQRTLSKIIISVVKWFHIDITAFQYISLSLIFLILYTYKVLLAKNKNVMRYQTLNKGGSSTTTRNVMIKITKWIDGDVTCCYVILQYRRLLLVIQLINTIYFIQSVSH